MSEIYYRHWRKMNHWPKIKMWTEKKLLKPHKLFGVFKYFDTEGFGDYGGGMQKLDKRVDGRLKKFYEKYPHALEHTELTSLDPENHTQGVTDPAVKFLLRQDKYMGEGFNEEKAFELAEKEFSEELQKEKYERSLFEGIATSNRSRSLMSVYEQKAEFEARQKVRQVERNLGQFKRYQMEMERKYEDVVNADKKENIDKNDNKTDQTTNEKVRKYEPATYRTADMKDEGRNSKSIKQSFTQRSQSVLDYFHSFAEIKDGISGLTDREIILRANETPQKLKDSFNTLIKRLDKYNIELNFEGKINYEKIKDQNALSWVKKNEKMISICLLSKDLDFELPHKVNRTDIKNKVLQEIEAEQTRLDESNRLQAQFEADERERLRRSKQNYENYFNILPNYNAEILVKKSDRFSQGADKNMKKFIKFDEFVQEFSKKFMFDNDLLYETYYYWEDMEEKEKRLRELWINSKKNKLENASRRPKAITQELNKLNENISDLVRNLRRKIDQTLLKNKKHPVFGANYRYLKYDEFMLDSEIEFHKIKKFLQNSPDTIKTDPEIGYKYQELIILLQRKKIEESVAAKFGDEVNAMKYQALPEEVEEEDELADVDTGAGAKGDKQIEKIVSKDKKVDKVDKELGKVKETIVSHFENILKSQGVNVKEKKTTGEKAMKSGKKIPTEKKK